MNTNKIVAIALAVGIVLMTASPMLMVVKGKQGENNEIQNYAVTERFYPILDYGGMIRSGATYSYSEVYNGVFEDATNFYGLTNYKTYAGEYFDNGYYIYQTYLTFAINTIPPSAIVNSATLHYFVGDKYVDTPFIIQGYMVDYDPTPFNDADWVDALYDEGAYIGEIFDSSDPSNSEYTLGFNPAYVDTSGFTQIVLRQPYTSSPSNNEFCNFIHNPSASDNYKFYIDVQYILADPVATFVPNQPVQWKDEYVFDASGSYHPDPMIDIEWYNWTITTPSTTLYYNNHYTEFQQIIMDESGTWQIRLDVTDEYGGTDTYIQSYGINNREPVAVVNANQQHIQGDFDFSAVTSYDPDEPYDSIVQYDWHIETYSGWVTLTDAPATITYPLYYIGTHNWYVEVFDEDGSSDTQNGIHIVDNRNPVAVAGSDQAGLKGTYYFDGSSSYDLDSIYGLDSITNYTWEFQSAYNGTSPIMYGETPSFDFKYSGVYGILLTVLDEHGGYHNALTTVTISDQDPIADAGADQTGIRGTYELIGNASYDPDDPYDWITIYQWRIFYDGLNRFENGNWATFDFYIVDNYEVRLEVIDNEGHTSYDYCWVNITNQLPVADAGVEQSGVMDTYNLDGSASYDPDNPYGWITNWTWEFTYDGGTKYVWGENPSFDYFIVDDYEITLTVTDNDGGIDTDTTWVNITNQLPVADAGIEQSGLIGIYGFDGSASYDPDNPHDYIANWTWEFTYDGGTEYVWEETTSFDFQRSGDYEITLTVTDIYGGIDTDTTWINITNQNPTADAGADDTLPYGQEYTFDGSGSYDIDGDVVNYTWTFTHNSTLTTIWEVSPTFRFWESGDFIVTLTVKDNFDALDQNQMTLSVNYDHAPIRIDSDTDFTIDNGVISGSGIMGDPYLIDGWYIDATGEGQAIYIGNTTAYYVVQNCTLYGSSGHNGEYGVNYYDDYGLTLNNADNGVVDNVIIDSANNYGMYIDECDFITINNTLIIDSINGIASWGNNMIITNNTITDSGTTDGSLYIYNSDTVLIRNNTISLTSELPAKAIQITTVSTNVLITQNTITNFIGNVIYITGSNGNTIYKNNFINHGTPYDDGLNDWDLGYEDTFFGNYWSEHSNIDIYHGNPQTIEGHDGIADSSYNNDNFPLVEYWENYTEPIAYTGEEATVYAWYGLELTFNASESIGVNYEIVNYTWEFTHNATPFTYWGEEISFTFWQIGIINFTLTVRDSEGTTATDWIDVDVSYHRDPIRINSDVDFDVGHGVVSGSGTIGDPYMIQDWYIDATGEGCGIYIGNTTAYFEIYNCVVHDADGNDGTYFGNASINLYNVDHGNVTETDIYNSYIGIIIDSTSTGVNIKTNNIYECYLGILTEGILSTYSYNEIYNGVYGMIINSVGLVNVYENDIYSCTDLGIWVYDSSIMDIYNNTIYLCTNQGLFIDGTSSSIDIYGNEIDNCGQGIQIEPNSINVYNNDISSCDEGLIANGINSIIYHNNFMYNTVHIVEGGSNTWDIGYQYGGNFYNIVTVDDYHGVNQDVLGSDNLNDVPYLTDNYPLINPYETDNDPVADAGIDLYYPLIHHLDGSESSDAGGSTLNYTWQFTYDGTPYTFWDEEFDFDFSTVQGHYEVTLTVRDSDGNIDVDTMMVYATELSADAGADQTHLRLLTTQFDGSVSLGLIDNWTWTFVHNYSLVELYGESPTYDFWQLGTTNVTLTVTDIYMDTAVDWVEITIENNHPIGDAGVSQAGIKGDYTLDASGSYDLDGTPVNWTWTFNDYGSPITLWGESVQYDFQDQQDYIITMTVRDNDGDTGVSTTWVNITWLYPIADAGVEQAGLKGYYTLDGHLSNDPDGLIVNYTWNFVFDGSPQEIYLTYPIFQFNQLGDYEITLTVTDDSGLTDTDTTWVNITNANPFADAGTDIIGKRLITFDGSGSSDIDGTIVDWKWTFLDDGTPREIHGVNAQYDFNITQAPITVTLEVTDDEGGTDTDTLIVTLVFELPIANAGASQGTNKGEYTLHGEGSYDPDGTIEDWTWTFMYNGHPEILHGVNPTFIFMLEVNTEITLTVMDDDGRFDTDTTWVNITFKEPVADFSYLPADTNKGIKVVSDESTDVDGYIVNWHWEFTFDGTDYDYYTDQFSFDFSKQGNYAITLTVEDNDGKIDSYVGYIEIISKNPIAIITDNYTTVMMFNPVDFDGSSSYDPDGTIYNYTWNFTYNEVEYTFYGNNFTYRFADAEGNVTVYLTVTDDEGMTNQTTVSFEVVNPNRLLADFLIILLPLIIVLLLVVVVVRNVKQTANTEDD